jgi:hypothetical protein
MFSNRLIQTKRGLIRSYATRDRLANEVGRDFNNPLFFTNLNDIVKNMKYRKYRSGFGRRYGFGRRSGFGGSALEKYLSAAKKKSKVIKSYGEGHAMRLSGLGGVSGSKFVFDDLL